MINASERSSEHAYARFTRRVQGVFIDAILFSLVMAGALIIAISFASDNIARFLEFTVAATWLLYEPILVSVTGGTVGHYLCNVRVVDDRGDRIIQMFVADHDFKFDFREEVHRVLAPAIDFGMALLAAESLDLADSHPFDPHFAEGVFDFF